MSCKIVYRRSLPPKVRAEVAPLIRKYRFILPNWLNTLAVIYHQDEEAEISDDVKNHVANVVAEYDYRQARLTICPRWHEAMPIFKEKVIAHELTHILLMPMQSWTDNVLTNGVTDDDMRNVLEEQWRVAVESVTEDTSAVFVARERKKRKA